MPGPRIRKVGHPAFKPTKAQRELVSALIQCGVPAVRARECITNPETGKPLGYVAFAKAFNDEIRISVDFANGKVTANLYNIATSKTNPSACDAAKYWLRCRAGWKFADATTKPAATDAPETFKSEDAVKARVAELWSRYGRNTKTGTADK